MKEMIGRQLSQIEKIEPLMQDWGIEHADAGWVGEFCDIYERESWKSLSQTHLINLPVKQMKNIFTITLLILAFVFTVSAQKTDTKKPITNKPNRQTTPAQPKKKVILSFARPEQMFRLLEGKWIFADMTCDESYTVTV